MKWIDLPPEIQEKMLCRQAEQNKGYSDPKIFIQNIRSPISEKGFMWSKTIEGADFWSSILNSQDYNVFYNIYPKKL